MRTEQKIHNAALDLEKLPLIVKKGGFTHKLIERTDDKCLYQKTTDGIPVGYEVFKTRITNAKAARIHFAKMNNSSVPDGLPEWKETYPGDEEFGKRAWAYPSLAAAIAAYSSLLSHV